MKQCLHKIESVKVPQGNAFRLLMPFKTARWENNELVPDNIDIRYLEDVVITIGGFMMGPMASLVISAVVALVEMVTISQTGPIGCLMNLISTCSFACTAALIYKKKHSINGAVVGLLAGSVAMIGAMLLWNWLITPLYMGTPRSAVEAMLLPVFLPFNALKAGLNTALILGLYKPLTTALRKTRLLPAAQNSSSGTKPGIYLVAAFLLATCILFLLVLQNKI